MTNDTKRRNERDVARERSQDDDASRNTDRQIDDNQDDLGRDANNPAEVANEINKQHVPGGDR